MARGDDRKIPIVRVDAEGKPDLQSLNEIVRQLFENQYKLEGRVGKITLRDDLLLKGALSLDARVDGVNTNPPDVSAEKSSTLYFDLTTNKLKVSENGGDYVNLIPLGFAYIDYAPNTTTVNNSTTLVDVPGLAFPVGASEEWAFRFDINGLSATAADYRFGLTGPASPTAFWAGSMSLTYLAGAPVVGGYAPTFYMPVGSVAESAGEPIMISGFIRNGTTSGTVQLQFAQNTATATNTRVFNNSTVIAWQRA